MPAKYAEELDTCYNAYAGQGFIVSFGIGMRSHFVCFVFTLRFSFRGGNCHDGAGSDLLRGHAPVARAAAACHGFTRPSQWSHVRKRFGF